jgi:hypothetical protein
LFEHFLDRNPFKIDGFVLDAFKAAAGLIVRPHGRSRTKAYSLCRRRKSDLHKKKKRALQKRKYYSLCRRRKSKISRSGRTQKEKMGVVETEVLREKEKSERATDSLPVLLLSRALHAKEEHFRFFTKNSSPPL